MEYFINEWRNKETGRHLLDQVDFTPPLRVWDDLREDAIHQYECVNKDLYEYLNTLVFDPEKGTAKRINLEEIIYARD